MAIPFGRITILVGAGIVGSVLAKEGRLPYVSDFVSGAFKIALKRISRDDSSTSKSKPRNDSLMAQVKSLQEELRMLASNRQMTIVTTGGTGGRKCGIIILVAVAGYGFVWFKGWKLPDMMFATKRSLSDACSSVARQLENVYSSIAATKRNLSSKMDHVDKSLEESLDLTADTQEKVSELRGRSDTFGRNIKSVRHAVLSLENKLCSFEEKQEQTNKGVRKLCNDARNMENQRAAGRIQAIPSSSSRPALELPTSPSPKAIPSSSSRPALELPTSPSPKAIPSSSSRPALELPTSPSPKQNSSLPIGFSVEELSPSDSDSESNGSSNQVQSHRRSLQNTVSDPGLMLEGTRDSNVPQSSILDSTSNGSSTPNGIGSSESTRSEAGNSGLSGLGLFTRTRSAVSAMSAVFWQSRPNVQS